MAESVSTCHVGRVPIQIIDKLNHGKITTLSESKSLNFSGVPSFNAFVTTITEYIEAKLAQENLCLTHDDSKARSLVQFAFLRVVVSENDSHIAPLLQPLEAPSSGVCRIYSPWIDIAIERHPVPSVQAIVRFSERQLLADQAALAGARNVPSGAAMPLSHGDFLQYKRAYLADLDPERYPYHPHRETIPLEKPIEELVPPDILWLLNHTPQGDMPPMETIAMMDAMEWGKEGYTKIVIALIDQCFASVGTDRHYNSILDVADLVPIEVYKIVMPTIARQVPAS